MNTVIRNLFLPRQVRVFIRVALFPILLFAPFRSWASDDIQAKLNLPSGVLRVGVDATFAPFEYIENGKKRGFDIELVEAIAPLIGAKKVEWVDLDFKGLIPGLQAKRFDMIASAMYVTEERSKVVDFSESYYPGGLVILVRVGETKIRRPEDLMGKRVSVQTGTKSVSYLKGKYSKIQLIEVEKNAEMFGLVETGRADAAVTGKPAAKAYVHKRPNLEILDKQLTVEEYSFAFRKDNSDLLHAVNKALRILKANGTLRTLSEKWFEGKG